MNAGINRLQGRACRRGHAPTAWDGHTIGLEVDRACCPHIRRQRHRRCLWHRACIIGDNHVIHRHMGHTAVGTIHGQ